MMIAIQALIEENEALKAENKEFASRLNKIEAALMTDKDQSRSLGSNQ